jgi:N-acyl homoserine lactone hydrolase
MKSRRLFALGSITLATLGAGLALKSFMPQRFDTASWSDREEAASREDTNALPEVDVTFLRCGSVTIPEFIAVRGAFSFAPRVISHSAVLIRHPRATFLYDTGLCAEVSAHVEQRPLLFRKTLGNFRLEQSLTSHLQQLHMTANNIDFVLLSHLHWDHVSGIPDLPGVMLRINRVEYEAAELGILDANNGLVRHLMGNNPIGLFDCDGPPYMGFRSSYDLFADGSMILVPLPGHTAGNTGMIINRANGTRVFLLGDAVWVAPNYQRPATMHHFIWSNVTSDDATARQTLIDLHHFSHRHPMMPLIAMHDADMQEWFTVSEQARKTKTPTTH